MCENFINYAHESDKFGVLHLISFKPNTRFYVRLISNQEKAFISNTTHETNRDFDGQFQIAPTSELNNTQDFTYKALRQKNGKNKERRERERVFKICFLI